MAGREPGCVVTWPTTWTSLRAYRNRAWCGCRYAVMVDENQRIVYVEPSPNRAQRCFLHMKASAEQTRAELLVPIAGIFDA